MVTFGVFGDFFKFKRTGIENYVFNLCRILERELNDFKFLVFSRKKPEVLPFRKNYRLIVDDRDFVKRLPFTLWLKFFSSHFINKYQPSLLWTGVPFIPSLLSKKTKTVLTVYDLNLFLVPETMRIPTFIAYRLFFKESVRRAFKVVTISYGTKKRLEEKLKVKVSLVVKPGVNREVFYPRSREEVLRYLKEKKLPQNYFLFVSTIEPRKNLEVLIEAFSELKREGRLKDFKLLVVGKKGWRCEKILRRLKSAKDVLYLGYVPLNELSLLYSGAKAMVLPSIYEGFGMPVLEARACGCCVVTSDLPELREAGGKGAIYVKPKVEDLKAVLLGLSNGKITCLKNFLLEGLPTWEEEGKKFSRFLKEIYRESFDS